MSTVIIGGGIIGLSTAYYLSLATRATGNTAIHIIDSSPALLTSASGYAGGFLASDWFSPAVSSLGALSFRLHRELAEKHNGQRRWGYAGSHVYSLSVDNHGISSKGEKGRREDWLLEGTSRAGLVESSSDGRGAVLNDDGSPAVFTPQVGGSLDTIASLEDCAQVEPKELCEFLLEESKKKGVHVHLSTKFTGVLTDSHGTLKGLKLESTGDDDNNLGEIECHNIVLSAGAWTPRVFKRLFPQSNTRIPISPLAGYSIAVKSPRYTTPLIDAEKRHIGGGEDNWQCYAIYCAPGRYWSYAPEAYARLARNGQTEVWVGGLNDNTLPLPELAVDVKKLIDPGSIESLRKTTVQLTGLAKEGAELNQDDLETVREGLCFRPVTQSGMPLISRVPENDLGGCKVDDGGGVWIAAGHGPWGISLSLGTGLVMSELLLGKEPSADIRALGLR
jgi:glycine/D-amino acid oxidase-like deaminating enzyme